MLYAMHTARANITSSRSWLLLYSAQRRIKHRQLPLVFQAAKTHWMPTFNILAYRVPCPITHRPTIAMQTTASQCIFINITIQNCHIFHLAPVLFFRFSFCFFFFSFTRAYVGRSLYADCSFSDRLASISPIRFAFGNKCCIPAIFKCLHTCG